MAVDSILDEIEGMKDNHHNLMAEYGRLGSKKITDPDKRVRYDALAIIIETLNSEIPSRAKYEPGDPRPVSPHARGEMFLTRSLLPVGNFARVLASGTEKAP